MNIYTERLHYSSNGRLNIFNITNDINSIVKKSKIESGICNISVIGSTASISTIEYENGLIEDIEHILEKLIPSNIDYAHNETWHDGNGYSHIRSFFIKTSQTFQIEKNQLLLGTWQQIILLDFDNKPRNRIISVKVMGE